ncbi:hypothetical protein MANES_07G047367v8 [Manihot esculenta]|uniref:Uncharacterized protein n=1 Tax=Manihot esculenta TaxID=3983 RepID=A0ACB7HFA9_MANES|nr:hypothetical protein MANES_07G047367v8 [Manihot esculenta]
MRKRKKAHESKEHFEFDLQYNIHIHTYMIHQQNDEEHTANNLWRENHEQQFGHRINPFSLHSKHLLGTPSSSSNTFLLPLQFPHGINLTSPHASQTNPGCLLRNPSRTLANSPVSNICLITSAPPTRFPLINTCGKLTVFPPNTLCNSFQRRSGRRRRRRRGRRRSEKRRRRRRGRGRGR